METSKLLNTLTDKASGLGGIPTTDVAFAGATGAEDFLLAF
jgi:hypothetical protein